MKYLILMLLVASSALADNGFIDLKELHSELKFFQPGSRDPLITNNGLGHSLDKELNLGIKLDLFRYFYFDNVVHSQMDNVNFRLIGWNYRLGFRVSDYVDVEWEHFSKHLLDATWPYDNPTQNSINIKIYLYRSKTKRDSLF